MFQWVLLFGFELVMASEEICQRSMCDGDVKFWLATTKNSAGQWMAETGMEHPKDSTSNGWRLQIDKESTDCDGEKFCRLVATLSADCSKSSNSRLMPLMAAPSTFPTTTTTTTPEPIVAGYIRIGASRYKLHTEDHTWEEARQICKDEGGHLAVIDRAEEVTALKKVMEGSTRRSAFIGFSDQAIEGEYVDIFGRPVKNFWADNEPNNRLGGNEDCGSVWKSGLMNDIPCHFKSNFICEKH